MYLEKKITYRNRIEIRKYHTTKYGSRGEKRQRRQQPTAEAMERSNRRVREKKLLRLLIANFEEGDPFVTLTYAREFRPDAEGAKQELRKFLRAMRASYRKLGIQLRYIVTTEWSNTAVHHHIVMNDAPGFMKLLTKHWTLGGSRISPLWPGYDYKGLAEYIIKETADTFREEGNPFRQAYSCSRNLVKPEESVRVVKADSWREQPKVPPALKKQGYVLDIDSVESGFDVFGFPFIEYLFIRPSGPGRKL